MKFDIVNTTARPMLYVTRKSGMDSDEIAGVMGEAFAAIGAFIGRVALKRPNLPCRVRRCGTA